MSSKKLSKLLLSTIPPRSNILYIGCSEGDMLNSLNPRYGLGVDSQEGDIKLAKKKYPCLDFCSKKVTEIESTKKFDFVIIDDAVPHMDDVFLTFKRIRELCKDDGKLIMTIVPEINLFCSSVSLFESKKAKNWIPKKLLDVLLYLSDFWPRPKIDSCIIADAMEKRRRRNYSYSIIIPAYNEEGNIANCVNRIPNFKRDCEIIVVNDGSKDRTSDIVKDLMKNNKRLRLVDYKKNKGKGYATKMGLDAAQKDVLMILDADMTVRPEDLYLFMKPFESKNAEFVQGTRMVYPIHNEAMGPVNMIGNKIFSMIFSYLLNQSVTDTLCGTKCMFRKDYKRMKMKDEDWPDFDLLFGASKLNLKLVEIPIHYQVRVAGESKMKIIKHGFMLLKASVRGFIELKIGL